VKKVLGIALGLTLMVGSAGFCAAIKSAGKAEKPAAVDPAVPNADNAAPADHGNAPAPEKAELHHRKAFKKAKRAKKPAASATPTTR